MDFAQRTEIFGLGLYAGALDRGEQEGVLEDIRGIVRAAPLFRPETRWGKPMRVRMTSAGRLGWVSDRRGYRYEPHHPSGVAWPAIPASILAIWQSVVPDRAPDCCLVNFYDADAAMGLHQDRDEVDFSHPVVSLSLGDEAVFRIGGPERRDPTRSFRLRSGDVLVMGGAARLAYHGVDRIVPDTSTLLKAGGRINVTLRAVG